MLDRTDLVIDHRLRAISRGHDRMIELVPPPHKPIGGTIRLASYRWAFNQGDAILSTKKLLPRALVPGTWLMGGGKGLRMQYMQSMSEHQ